MNKRKKVFFWELQLRFASSQPAFLFFPPPPPLALRGGGGGDYPVRCSLVWGWKQTFRLSPPPSSPYLQANLRRVQWGSRKRRDGNKDRGTDFDKLV